MEIIVQKYGGTSVATFKRIKNVAERIIEIKKKGYYVVVVVSAMGDTTDDLITLAKKVSKSPLDREMDMLLSTGEQVSIALVSMAIQEKGYSAISFTGAQAGIITDGIYSKARILRINSQKILNSLKEGKIVIIAGFQGINTDQEITTLGRGGSDTSAVVLAAGLKAKRCEIYTDVDGVYTTDPRIVKEAKKLNEITYSEMLELASLGAKVLHPRAVEVAKEYKVPLYVLSSFKKVRGTMVKEKLEKEKKVSGVAYDKNVAKISIMSVPDRPGIAAKLFQALAKEKINVDMIIQNVTKGKVNDISFTVSKNEAEKALKISEKICKELEGEKVLYDDTLAKVSIVGAGMISSYGVAAKMFKSLGDNNINIETISTSEIKISCLISAKYAEKAVKVLHKEFNLQK